MFRKQLYVLSSAAATFVSSPFCITMGNCSVSNKAAQYNSGPGAPGSVVGSIENGCMVHDGPVLGLCYADTKTLLSCGDDRRIAVTNLTDLIGSPSYVPRYLVGHSKAVNRVQCYDSQIWSTSRDLSIRMVSVSYHGNCLGQ